MANKKIGATIALEGEKEFVERCTILGGSFKLNADIGTQAPDSKTGRKQVKAGGKGTQGKNKSLAFRPRWHLGEIPLATQFDRLNPETGVKELFPENYVWAECDMAADVDYQEEAMSYGYNKNGKFQHSLAGLPKLPENGYYRYRTNPNPDTVPWLITGAMKVNRILSDSEVNEILAEKGISPNQRQGGNKTLADLGLSQYEGVKYSERYSDIRYSDRNYSYAYLTSKPDIKPTVVVFSNPLNRAETVIEAKKNIAKIEKINEDGSLSVTVKDIGNDVVITTDRPRHGLQRNLNISSPITTHIGVILENSIKINELNPKKNQPILLMFLIGAATDNYNNLYVVRSIVNSFSNEMSSVYVLYAMNAKKETAATKSPRFANNSSLSFTVSSVSVSDLLDIVNDHFPDVLSESVLRHYGYTQRPDGEIGKYALHSDRNPSLDS